MAALNLSVGQTPTIGRAPLDGSPIKADLITGLGLPTGVATDGNTLHWADNQTG